MLLRFKKIVVIIAVIILIAAVFAWGSLENIYVTYPRSPDPQQGKIVPHAVKGIVVYITQSQSDLLSWLTWIGFGSAAIAALVTLINRGDPLKSKQ
jgi:hypothetical protein